MERKEKKINKKFFCDGPYYLLTSSSLGGSSFTPAEISDELLQTEEGIKTLLSDGIALPLFFPGDCALDSSVSFVLGDLTAEQEQNWIGKITAKLKVPCGKFILLAGGGVSEDLEAAISGVKPDPDYVFYDTFKLPPGDYLVEVYCFVNSMNFAVEFDVDFADSDDFSVLNEDELSAQARYYLDNFQKNSDSYLIRFLPLEEEIELPEQVEEINWCGVFKYR